MTTYPTQTPRRQENKLKNVTLLKYYNNLPYLTHFYQTHEVMT